MIFNLEEVRDFSLGTARHNNGLNDFVNMSRSDINFVIEDLYEQGKVISLFSYGNTTIAVIS